MRVFTDFETAKTIIQSKSFDNYSMANRYRELEARTGFDFSHAIALLERLPVFLNGDVHFRIRKAMARQISHTKECQFAHAQVAFRGLLEKHFKTGARPDLVTELAQPLWRSISTVIVPRNALSVELVDQVPGLFSPILSIRERLRINALIGDYTKEFPSEDALVLLGLAALGARPFVGTWSLAIDQILLENPGRPLSEIAWPDAYPVSSLTYVDRVCTELAPEHEIKVSERVRCMTQHPGYSTEQRKMSLFGFGAHTCLGKSISEKVWTMTVAELAKFDLIATCLGADMSPHSDPFHMPSSIRVMLA
jgi:hypothetical protein